MPKISAYPASGVPQATDQFVLARAGNNFSALGGYLFPREGEMINGKLSPTVAANNLTLAVKTLAGTDPSVANPVLIMIGGTLRPIIAALSVSWLAGTNRMYAGGAELATKEIDIFAYIGWNATDGVTLAGARFPWANVYADFNRVTAADERYAPVSNATNAVATDQYVNVGRFAATNSGTPNYNWSVPAYTPTNLVQYPIFETRILAYTSVDTGFTGSPSGYTRNTVYQIVGKNMVLLHVWTGGAAASSTTGFTITIPFSANAVMYFPFLGADNGALLFCTAITAAASRTLTLAKGASATAASWTAASTKFAIIDHIIPIA